MQTERDRRGQPRVGLSGWGTVELDDRTLECEVVDVSRTGLSVVVDERPPMGVVRVRFQLGDRDAAWTEVEGQVVRSRDHEDGIRHVWGMRLQPMDWGTRTRFKGYVADKLRPDATGPARSQ